MLPYPSPLLFQGPSAGGGPFNPASLFTGGVAGAFYDPSDISTLWKDTAGTSPVTADGDAVARIDDKSGNGNHLLQGTLANRPLYKTSGGQSWLLPDGSNDYMQKAFTMSAFWDRVTGIRPITAAIAAKFIGGGTADIDLFNAGGTFGIFSGGTKGGPGFSFNTDYVVYEQYRPSSPFCQLAADNGSLTTGNAIAGANPGGFTLAAKFDATGFTSFRWHGSLMIDRALTSGELASLRTYFAAKQGRVL